MDLSRRLASRLLPHDNGRCVAPPGRLPQGAAPPVVVASLMRSGTHLLIDLILNNFAAYRHTPLYVDADAWFRAGNPPSDLASLEGCVVKTHFPQLRDGASGPAAEAALDRLATRAVVFQPRRDSDPVFDSLQRFGYRGDRAAFEAERESFESFWAKYDPVILEFADLADPASSHQCLLEMAEVLHQPPPATPVLSPAKSDARSILWSKALTRLLGRRARRINTSIQLGTSSRG